MQIDQRGKRRSTFQLNPMNMIPQVAVRHHTPKRPVDKLLVCISLPTLVASQQAVTLVTATFPCTIVGLRWDLKFITGAGTGPGSFAAAIVIVRDGNSASTLSIGNAATLYQPEQDVLFFARGLNALLASGDHSHYNGTTKTMRKMMGGDKLQLIAFGEATNSTALEGCVQFFCKT